MPIALFEPEIPQNTGNIIRLCANTGISLNLIEPLGFSVEDKHLRRAGLDYHQAANITVHASWANFCHDHKDRRVIAFSTKATTLYHHFTFDQRDILLFGPESRGLSESILATCDQVLRLPMQPSSRSLNLANTVSIVVYEMLRQQGFPGLS